MKEKIKGIIKKIRYSKVSLLVAISFALFTDMVCYGIILPIIPIEMEKKYHRSQITTGFLFSMFSAGCLVGTPIFGILSDRIGRKIPFIIGMVMLATSTILFAYGHYIGVLFVARFVQGLSSAVSWVIGLSMIADIFPNEQFGTASGTVIGGNTIGALVGPIIGGIAYEHFGYVVPFYISAAFAIVDLLIRLCLVSDKALEHYKKEKDLKQSLITVDNSYIINQDKLSLTPTLNGDDVDGNIKNNNKQSSNYNKLNDQEEEEEEEQDNIIIKQDQYQDNQDIIDSGNKVEDGASISIDLNKVDGIRASSNSTSPITRSTSSYITSDNKSEIINYNDDVNSNDGNDNDDDHQEDKKNIGMIILDSKINGNTSEDPEETLNDKKRKLLKEMNQEKDFYKNSLVRIDVWILLVIIIFFAIGLSCLEPLLPLLIENKFKRSTSMTSLLFSMFTLPFLILSPIAGWLTDNGHIRRTKMTFVGAIITSICFPFISKTNHLAVLFIVIILIGSGLALFFSPIVPILTFILDPKGVGNNNAKILSLFCFFYSVGICIGPVFSTTIVQLSYLAFTISYSVLLMISTVIFNIYFMKRPVSSLENF